MRAARGVDGNGEDGSAVLGLKGHLVCVCVCVYVCMYVCIYIYICVYIYKIYNIIYNILYIIYYILYIICYMLYVICYILYIIYISYIYIYSMNNIVTQGSSRLELRLKGFRNLGLTVFGGGLGFRV